MARPSIHTIPSGNGWANKSGGRTLSNHRLKRTAQAAGRRAALKRHAEHVIHNKDGRIGGSNSYGGDPNPPRG